MIAFGSIEHGVGTTCISLALSNFLCNKLGMRIAYVELNTTNQISCLSFKKKNVPFSHMGVYFFPAMTITSFHELSYMDFDCIVIDMGILNAYTANEFSKCSLQFLVCSLSEWKKASTLSQIEQLIKNNYIHSKHVTVLGNVSIKKSKLVVSPNTRCYYHQIPFLENPFQLVTSDFTFFYQILERR